MKRLVCSQWASTCKPGPDNVPEGTLRIPAFVDPAINGRYFQCPWISVRIFIVGCFHEVTQRTDIQRTIFERRTTLKVLAPLAVYEESGQLSTVHLSSVHYLEYFSNLCNMGIIPSRLMPTSKHQFSDPKGPPCGSDRKKIFEIFLSRIRLKHCGNMFSRP